MHISEGLQGECEDDEMARAKKPLDEAKVDDLVQKLQTSLTDAEDFRQIYLSIVNNDKLSTLEVVSIAHKFVGGQKPKSRKAALTAIGQERLRLVHAKAKSATAAKSKTW